jgi:ubiquitin C-terminal hydrolase
MDTTTCLDLKGLPNIGNSCYLDSILFALFATRNTFIDRHILKARKLYGSCETSVQEQKVKKELQLILQSIANHFRNEKTNSVLITSCQSLRAFIRIIQILVIPLNKRLSKSSSLF